MVGAMDLPKTEETALFIPLPDSNPTCSDLVVLPVEGLADAPDCAVPGRLA